MMTEKQLEKYKEFKRNLCRHFPDSDTEWCEKTALAMWAFEYSMGLFPVDIE
jgi:hypothetical protein